MTVDAQSANTRVSAQGPQLVLWPGILGSLPYEDQLAITSKARFEGLAISPLLVDKLLKSGLSYSDITEMAAKAGVKLTHLDGMSSWSPEWFPSIGSPTYARYHDRFNFSAELCLEMCEALGLTGLAAVGPFDVGAVGDDVLADSLAAFSERAAGVGVFVELEFIPHTGINTVKQAAGILKNSGATNAGLMIDTWHICKSPSNLESDLDFIRALPAGTCTGMQLTDSNTLSRQDFYAELLREGRGFPGEGVLPIAEITAAVLVNNPDLASIGPEPSGEQFLALSVDELARRTGDLTRKALADAAKSIN